MSTTLLRHSMFQDVLFPVENDATTKESQEFRLRQIKRFVPDQLAKIREFPLVVFDLETTGLDYDADRIIEIGAIKLNQMQPASEFSSLVSTDVELTDEIIRLTGITPEMLSGKPAIEDVLTSFLEFISGTILVAHNAEFDLTMITKAFGRMGLDLEWPTFCTLKMAREILPDLENKKLDTLADHYGLSFESRHRSIGDVKVTCGVLNGMFSTEGRQFKTWEDMQPFKVEPKL